ncbi:response regulator transcription factor [Rhodocaloribacter litoris]|uniref:response regulator n=1 Tax=Rhodocaloribacter litoris TaxID=2558931 RepID=UPI00141EFC5C|nr:response regulator transcription factor [Rhodocaloribacter litoris]QXD15640.1 response regulator transcription factor [Rhodocaloribacter litoris]
MEAPVDLVEKQQLKVVVSDDSEHVRRRLIHLLAELDHVDVVAETDTVASTIDTIQALRPDVVILDIHMPDGSGIRALRDIKATLPATQVIMLTNHANPFYQRACMKAGASYFFDKSTEFERVSEVLRQMSSSQT